MARKIRRDNLRSLWLHRLLDIGVNWLAVTLAYVVKETLRFGIPTEPVTARVVVHTFVVVALIWLGVASGLDIYRYKRRMFNEIVVLIGALILTIAFLNTYVYFTRPFENFIYPRYGMILYAVIGAALLAGSRAIKFAARGALHRRGLGVRRVAIVGTGPTARRLAAAFREDEALGCHFVGFLADEPLRDETPDLIGCADQIEDIIHRRRIEEIVIALPGNKHQRVLDVAQRCQALDVRLRVVPDFFEVVMIRASLSEIDDIPLIGLRDPVITGYQSLVKRVFDIGVAVFCLALASPLFVAIAILIRWDSRGSFLFRQVRVGENGRPFNMYKFRSMVPDAEKRLSELVKIGELPEPVFKIQDDPRVTRVGRWLRRLSLDELPQLFNVLKGDMSMVGPRPEELQVVKYYQLWHRKRLSIKPGITGPMQVSGRAELPLDERIRLELMYISRYS
ncbi:MAG TPA: sugar transferase, partial [Phycisphaerae bacterium]|nr:sugar transferase [Phycisphaerae bacterium]